MSAAVLMLAEYKLPNGESRPTFEQYLLQAKKCKKTKLIIEFKKQPSQEREALLVEKTIKMLKDNGMSVNVWTVNKKKDIQKMINLGVDAITTNEPLLVRELLGEQELKN